MNGYFTLRRSRRLLDMFRLSRRVGQDAAKCGINRKMLKRLGGAFECKYGQSKALVSTLRLYLMRKDAYDHWGYNRTWRGDKRGKRCWKAGRRRGSREWLSLPKPEAASGPFSTIVPPGQ